MQSRGSDIPSQGSTADKDLLRAKAMSYSIQAGRWLSDGRKDEFVSHYGDGRVGAIDMMLPRLNYCLTGIGVAGRVRHPQ